MVQDSQTENKTQTQWLTIQRGGDRSSDPLKYTLEDTWGGGTMICNFERKPKEEDKISKPDVCEAGDF